MKPHPKIRLLLWLDKIQTKANVTHFEPSQARTFFDKNYRQHVGLIDYAPIKMVSVENYQFDQDNANIPVRIYKPVDEKSLPVLMYFHGGGFVVGSLDAYDRSCRRLAQLSKCIVVSVDYRLAPEYPFPIPAEDCYASIVWAQENIHLFGGDPDRIAVAGDSAGGNLATVSTIMARDRQGPTICHQALVYPSTDATMSSPSIDKWSKGYYLTKEMMTWFVDHYAPKGIDRKDPYLSPLFATDLKQLPAATIITASHDPLVDEGNAYATRLREAGISVNHKEFPGMIHAFFAMPKWVKASREAYKMIAKDLTNSFEKAKIAVM